MPPITPADWQQVFTLLDTALDLPEAARDAWLRALPPAQQHLTGPLRDLLGRRAAIESGDFLRHPPTLGRALQQAADEPRAGDELGPWRLIRELGHGGMAHVWLAERADGAHQRCVALKLPLRAQARGIAERFARERRILSTLVHPNIAQVLDAGTAGDQPWLALEFVDGRPITEHAEAQALDVRARLALFLPVLAAVQHAHGQLVIHRDLKPGNVLVAADGTVKLLDFGVAKLLQADGATADTALTQAGGRAMTPQYASPEQVAGQPLGVASDVYSLGVLLYELLTGRLPYRLPRDTPAALEEAILAAAVVRPSAAVADPRTARALRGDVDTLVMKALAAEPARRYATAAALAADIERHLHALPIAARPPTWAYLAGRWLRRHRLAALAGGAATLALVAGTGVALWQADRARNEARRAHAVQQFLVRLLQTTDPQQGEGHDVTAGRLLDLNAGRIETEFAGQPDVQARLLHTLANLYVERGEPAKGRPLLDKALALYAAQGAEAREAEVQAQFDLSELLFESEEPAAARDALARTDALAARYFGEPNPWTVPVLAGLAWADWNEGKIDSARTQVARAERQLDLRLPAHRKTSGVLATIELSTGQVLRARELLAAAQQAAAGDPGYGAMDRAMDGYNLARVRYILGEYAQAEAELQALVPRLDALAGAGHDRTLLARGLLAQTLAERGQTAEAVALMQANVAAALARGDGGGGRANVQRTVLARLLRLNGQAAEALPPVQLALADAERQSPRPTAQREAMRRVQAEVLLALGRQAEGVAALDAALANLRAIGGAQAQLGVPEIELMLAVALRATPRAGESPGSIERACAALTRERPADSLPLLRCQAVQAWLAAAQAAPGERQAALTRFVQAREALFAAGLHERHPLRAELLAAEAELLAATPGRAADAEALLARADALHRSLLAAPLPQPLLVLH